MPITDTLSVQEKKTILVVDDSTAVRIRVADVLTRYGYHVLEAVDGMNALEILAKEPDVDLVMADLHMPRMDGLELLRNLRRDSKYLALPVLMQTMEAQASAMTKARQAGATGWLIKPVSEQSLVRAIERLLRER